MPQSYIHSCSEIYSVKRWLYKKRHKDVVKSPHISGGFLPSWRREADNLSHGHPENSGRLSSHTCLCISSVSKGLSVIFREMETGSTDQAGHAPMIGVRTLRVGGAIEYRFIFGLVQAGPESNLATPAQLDTTGSASRRRLRSPLEQRLAPCGCLRSLQSGLRSMLQK